MISNIDRLPRRTSREFELIVGSEGGKGSSENAGQDFVGKQSSVNHSPTAI